MTERVWALAWPASGFLLLFLALSLFDIWAFVAPAFHKLAVAALAAASVYAFARNLESFAFPRTKTAMRRLENESGLAHRPLDMLGETLAAGRGDPVAEALWQAQEARDQERAKKIRPLWPRLSLAARDPRALRFLGLLIFAAGIATAGPEALPRLDKAFTLADPARAQSALRIDAWIDPPAYTKLPPVFLSQGTPHNAADAKPAQAVPAGSKLTVRVQGLKVQPRLKLSFHDPARRDRIRLKDTGPEAFFGTVELKQPATVELKSALSTLARFEIAVAADTPPVIAFVDRPQETAQKALRITYRTLDDFGIVAVTLRMSRTDGQASPVEEIDLPAPTGAGQAVLHANKDLTAHPWAGLPVRLSLLARDGAGQDGTSEPFTVTLPERVFTNPLARALAAARRDMMRDPRQIAAAAKVIDQVSEALANPEHPVALLLALRSAYWSLSDAAERNEDARLHAAQLMWQVAIAIEDGAVGQAKGNLDQARQALADALKAGAPETEIAQRMAQLRQALAQYLTAVQSKMTEPMQGPVNPAVQAITPQDFARLLDTLENLARTGAKDEAGKLLSALDDILQNMAANNGRPKSAGESAQDEAMKALADLIGQQRALMDETFRATQGDKEEKTSGALKGLAERQETLRKALGQAMTALGEQTGSIPKSLGSAERAMSGAREALGGGQGRSALTRQQDALEALREGARDVAQAMARDGPGSPGHAPGFGGMPSSDPFGRPNAGMPDQGDSVKVPNGAEAQRARAILEEIRRRAAERGRPAEELDYLDRLLQRF